MVNPNDSTGGDDPFELSRFYRAQDSVYANVLAELKAGHKRTHWMWYIFPQIDGLGTSPTAHYYAIKSIAEARQYLDHAFLETRLLECVQAVLAIEGHSISQIFSYPDDLKLKSSMTLFACVADTPSSFDHILDKYFQGERDIRTLHILELLKEKSKSGH